MNRKVKGHPNINMALNLELNKKKEITPLNIWNYRRQVKKT